MIALTELLAYDRWANHKILDAAMKLDTIQFTRTLGGSFASVRDTLVHLAWAEWIWTKRWKGTSPQERADPRDFPTAESIAKYMEEIEAAQMKIFAGGDPDMRGVRIRYTNLKQEIWEYSLEDMVHHLTFHSAYHRGQIATLLRQLGEVPPTTDYLVYLDEARGPKQ